MSDIKSIKQRFGIIGVSPLLDRALEKAVRVAPTDISVLVTGESGVGKEAIPKIIHGLSHRKHAPYIAVNCGAIPEGTIDSELFGHEKGAFTGATGARKGYFEEADGGTIFLDEVGAGVNRTLLGKIGDAIVRLNQERGYTFCLIEHDMDFVARLCDPVICMAEGTVLAEGTIDEVKNNEAVIESYLGTGLKNKEANA